MDVSVIILARQSAGLPAAVASVVAQTISRRLDVVVADCAPDPTSIAQALKPYLQRFHHRRAKVVIRHVRSDADRPTVALNAALAATHAPFVAFLAAGDYWNRFKLQRQFAAIRDGGSVGLVHTACRHIDGQGRFIDHDPQTIESPSAGYCLGQLLRRNDVALSSVLLRRNVLDHAAHDEPHKLPFDPDQNDGYEYDLALRIARLTRFIYVPQPLTHLARSAEPRSNPHQLIDELESDCRILINFLERHADPHDRDADPNLHVQRFLYDRAQSLIAEQRLADARSVCQLAKNKDVFDAAFVQLAHDIRPTLLERITRILRPRTRK